MSLEPKRFNTGMGRVHGQDLTNIYQAVSEFAPDVSVPPAEGYGVPRLAVVTASTLLEEAGGYELKWRYALKFISPTYATKDVWSVYDPVTLNECWQDSGFDTGGNDVAINLTEIGNSATNIMGVDPTNLPDDYQLQAVPDGAVVMAYSIPMTYEKDNTTEPGKQGSLVFFTYTNQFDGSC